MVKLDEYHIKPDPIRFAPNWKGGRIKGSCGYVYVKKRNHPFASQTGYVREHRLVMEVKLGRYLSPDEHVHHINGNKEDNRPENLELVTMAEHRAIHNKLDKRGKRKFDKELALSLYQKGFSIREVAKRVGASKSAVADFVKEMGVSRPQLPTRDKNGKFKKRVIA